MDGAALPGDEEALEGNFTGVVVGVVGWVIMMEGVYLCEVEGRGSIPAKQNKKNFLCVKNVVKIVKAVCTTQSSFSNS